MHGSGPAGTATIYILTDFVFMLPISALFAWEFEFEDLCFGFLPPAYGLVAGVPRGRLQAQAQEKEQRAKYEMKGTEYPVWEVYKVCGILLLL